MKISIIDPGLINKTGHHADLDYNLALELVARNHELTIYTNEKIENNLALKFNKLGNVSPVLKTFPYGHQKYAGELYYYQYQSYLFAKELKQIPPADLYLFPSLFLEQFNALSILPPSQKIFSAMHLPPSWPEDKSKNLWKLAFQTSNRKNRNTILGIFEPELFLEYEQLMSKSDLSISILPIPFEGIEISEPKKDFKSVAILGHQRKEKNLHLPELIAGLTDIGLQVSINDSSEKLKLLKNSDKIKTYGYVENLAEIISKSDSVLLPYNKEFYRFNGSGVAWQSICSGVPIVAPAGTSISRNMYFEKNGVLFYNDKSEDILNAVMKLKNNYSDISKKSFAAMKSWRTKNSIKLLVDLIDEF